MAAGIMPGRLMERHIVDQGRQISVTGIIVRINTGG